MGKENNEDKDHNFELVLKYVNFQSKKKAIKMTHLVIIRFFSIRVHEFYLILLAISFRRPLRSLSLEREKNRTGLKINFPTLNFKLSLYSFSVKLI